VAGQSRTKTRREGGKGGDGGRCLITRPRSGLYGRRPLTEASLRKNRRSLMTKQTNSKTSTVTLVHRPQIIHQQHEIRLPGRSDGRNQKPEAGPTGTKCIKQTPSRPVKKHGRQSGTCSTTNGNGTNHQPTRRTLRKNA